MGTCQCLEGAFIVTRVMASWLRYPWQHGLLLTAI